MPPPDPPGAPPAGQPAAQPAHRLPVSQRSAAEDWGRLKAFGASVRGRALQLRGQLDTDDVQPLDLAALLNVARDFQSHAPALAAVPGLQDHVRTHAGRPAFDLPSAMDAAQDAVAELVAAIIAEFPRDPATGHLREREMGPDGALAQVPIPAAALPRVNAAVEAVLAAIE